MHIPLSAALAPGAGAPVTPDLHSVTETEDPGAKTGAGNQGAWGWLVETWPRCPMHGHVAPSLRGRLEATCPEWLANSSLFHFPC